MSPSTHPLERGLRPYVLRWMNPTQEGPKAAGVVVNQPQSFIEDELFLGPQTGEGIAKRRAGYASQIATHPSVPVPRVRLSGTAGGCNLCVIPQPCGV
jgi:hypothetical protein